MNTALALYAITRLDSLATVFVLLAIFSLIVMVLAAITHFTTDPESQRHRLSDTDPYYHRYYYETLRTSNIAKGVLRFWWVCALAWGVAVLVPTKRDAIFIAAGVGVVEAAKSETAQRLASKSVLVIEEYLDDLVKEKKK